MRRLVALAVAAVFLAGCQTSRVTLLAHEPGDDPGGSAVGAVVLLDPETEAEKVELATPDVELKSTRDREGPQRPAKRRGFAALLQGMPKPPERFRLYFETGKVVVADRSREDLARLLALWSRVGPVSEMQITGHTDTVGGREENDRLSRERAEAVLEAMRNQGFVFEGNSRATGRGERDLLVKTADEVDEPENRRVEITVR
ncbi:OmpA family protein [uncultured Phenylobacterium sp.]|uniref:OmpA family protein n=1 Tax=uncultured Phenylobacterium sp. TaxID=349273 RepID=UPI0025EC4B05|nr:OmpA family protein [uncultured Phenylobacterium sp.]